MNAVPQFEKGDLVRVRHQEDTLGPPTKIRAVVACCEEMTTARCTFTYKLMGMTGAYRAAELVLHEKGSLL